MLTEIYGMELEELFNLGLTYLIANGGVLLGFIVYIIRLKLKEMKMSEVMNATLEKMNVKMNDEAIKKVDEIQKTFELEMAKMQKALYLKIDENEEERQRIIEEKSANVKASMEAFQKSNESIDEDIETINQYLEENK